MQSAIRCGWSLGGHPRWELRGHPSALAIVRSAALFIRVRSKWYIEKIKDRLTAEQAGRIKNAAAPSMCLRVVSRSSNIHPLLSGSRNANMEARLDGKCPSVARRTRSAGFHRKEAGHRHDVYTLTCRRPCHRHEENIREVELKALTVSAVWGGDGSALLSGWVEGGATWTGSFYDVSV